MKNPKRCDLPFLTDKCAPNAPKATANAVDNNSKEVVNSVLILVYYLNPK